MIYVSTACIKGERIRDILIEFGENGIYNIELSGGTAFYEGLEKDLISLKEKYNFNYVCHAYFPPPKEDFVVNLASCNDNIYGKSLEHYQNAIQLMTRIGCCTLSIHAGFIAEISADEIGKEFNTKVIYDRQRAIERFCNAYTRIESSAAMHGIDMYLENNVLSKANYERWNAKNHMLMTDYDSIMEISRYINYNLLLDMGHLNVSANTLCKDFKRECQLLAPYVKWMHLSHNNGVADEHKPLNQEGRIYREFVKMNYCGNITLETQGSIKEILASLYLLSEISGD